MHMLFHVFASGILIILTGIIGVPFVPKMPGFEVLRGALTLGGGLVICAVFMLKMPWHGLIGAGVVALLGAGKRILGLKDFPAFLAGDRSRGLAPVIEIGITLVCAVLVLKVVRVLMAERTRRMLDDREKPANGRGF